MCLGKTLDHFKKFCEQGVKDGSKIILTIRKTKPSAEQYAASRMKLGIKSGGKSATADTPMKEEPATKPIATTAAENEKVEINVASLQPM